VGENFNNRVAFYIHTHWYPPPHFLTLLPCRSPPIEGADLWLMLRLVGCSFAILPSSAVLSDGLSFFCIVVFQ